MPSCRNCGARLSKFDTDICPVCGTKKPLEGVSSETVEITTGIDLSSEDLNYKPKRKTTLFLLFVLIGWTGLPLFYLGETKKAIIWALINILGVIAGIGSLLAFILSLGALWGYLCALLLAYVINIVFGIVIYFKHDLKDGAGEFVH